MKTQNNKLFAEFSPVSKEMWVEKACADLKGADFNKKLVWKNLNGIDLQPFYNAEDTISPISNTGENSPSLINYRTIVVSSEKEANIEALRAVQEGMSGVVFHLTAKTNIATLLEGINLENIAVSFLSRENALDHATQFFAFAQKQGVDSQSLRGYFDQGIVTDFVTKGTLAEDTFDTLAKIIKAGAQYPNYKTLTVSGVSFLDSGANQAQEIAYTLNAVVHATEECKSLGIDPSSSFNALHIQLAIGSEYFVEIAKYRALNSLLHEIAKKYDVASFSHSLTAKTSIWTKSITDAHTNMLRATTETMSAILGNVDGVLIDPFDSEFNGASKFSNRIAGNIATILKEESYFGKVANPVDGSYYIEEVSAQLSEKALGLFKAVEAEAGLPAAFAKGLIQREIAEVRQKKVMLISQRRLPLVGVNKYPNLMEEIDPKALADLPSEENTLLVPRRASLEIEALRKESELIVSQAGKRPIVELASFGNLTMRKARAAFAYDFMGVSGFEVWQEKSFESAQQAAEASAKSASNIVVICSSDEDYDAEALNYIKTFRSINKDKVLLLAGNPADIDNLASAGLDGCVNLKSDVIITLSKIQAKVKKQV